MRHSTQCSEKKTRGGSDLSPLTTDIPLRGRYSLAPSLSGIEGAFFCLALEQCKTFYFCIEERPLEEICGLRV